MKTSSSNRFATTSKARKDEDLALFHNMRMREQNSALLHSQRDEEEEEEEEAEGNNNGGGGGKFLNPISISHKTREPQRQQQQQLHLAGGADAMDPMTSSPRTCWTARTTTTGTCIAMRPRSCPHTPACRLLTPPGTPLFPSLDRDLLSSTSAVRKSSRLSTVDNASISSSSSSASSRPAARHPSPSPRASATMTGRLSNGSINGNGGSIRRPSTPTRSSPSYYGTSCSSVGRTPAAGGTANGNGNGGARTTSTSSRSSTPTRSAAAARSSTPTQRSSSIASSSAAARPSTPTRRPMSTPSLGSNSSLNMPARGTPASRGTSPMRQPQPRRVDPVTRATPERPSSASRSATIPSRSATIVGVDPRRLNRSYNMLQDRENSTVGGAMRGAPSPSPSPAAALADDKSTSGMKKSSTTTRLAGSRETSFYGTSISKKSLDTAIRHMDIRRSSPSGFRPLLASSTTNVATTSPASYPKFSPPIASRASCRLQKPAMSNGPRSNGKANDLDIFTAAANGSIDNFLLDSSSGLEDLQSCRREEVARELQILEQQQCGHRFGDSS